MQTEFDDVKQIYIIIDYELKNHIIDLFELIVDIFL